MIYNISKAIIKNKLGIFQYPSFATFLITWRCNSKCVFCDVWKKDVDIKSELTIGEIENIFGQLKKLDVLRLSGGEPFLRTDLADVVNVIDKVNSPSLIHFTTNGFLTEQIVDTMNNIKSLDKVHIKVSIDNIGEKHDKTRGIPGAYEKAYKTVMELVKIREKKNFHIGINQVIVNEDEINSYFKLKEIFDKVNVPIYPIIAHKQTNSLYSDQKIVNPENSFETFGEFSKKELERFMTIAIKHSKEVSDFKERIIDSYNIKGMKNRLIEKKNVPNPKCVALNNHLRILPNGDVPVCLYNGSVVGNLRDEKFKDVWFGDKIKPYRDWVKKCPGCWEGCETIVSAIYTGDIWKGLFY